MGALQGCAEAAHQLRLARQSCVESGGVDGEQLLAGVHERVPTGLAHRVHVFCGADETGSGARVVAGCVQTGRDGPHVKLASRYGEVRGCSVTVHWAGLLLAAQACSAARRVAWVVQGVTKRPGSKGGSGRGAAARAAGAVAASEEPMAAERAAMEAAGEATEGIQAVCLRYSAVSSGAPMRDGNNRTECEKLKLLMV